MARKRGEDGEPFPSSKGKVERKTERFNDTRFVNYELDKEEQQECKAHVWTSDDLDNFLLEAVSDGYRVSFSYDSKGECYTAYMSSTSPSGPNAGLILTGRGSSPIKSGKQLWWKHNVSLQRDWAEWAERPHGYVIDD